MDTLYKSEQSFMRYRYFNVVLLCINLVCYNFVNHAQQSETLTIFAASSLTDAFSELKDTFMEQYPNSDLLINFASSSTLAAQINAGAPADIFASANPIQMQVAVDDGRIQADDVQVFATNQLVMVMPADNPGNIMSLEDLSNDSVLLVLAVPDVPIRTYTDAVLEALNTELGEGFSERVLSNLVSEEANVRQVVTRIALGEADAGIVYQSDIIGEISDQVTVIPIDTSLSPLPTYPIATLSDSLHLDIAETFIEFVLSGDGQMILHSYGFCSPAIIEDQLMSEVTPEVTSEPFDETDDTPTSCK
jgi:molybdate transport system substrate-binding protein